MRVTIAQLPCPLVGCRNEHSPTDYEFATNAAKYGALSSQSSHVDVSWSVWKDELLLVWREHGGHCNGQPENEGLAAYSRG
jgi:hypothetical protein